MNLDEEKLEKWLKVISTITYSNRIVHYERRILFHFPESLIIELFKHTSPKYFLKVEFSGNYKNAPVSSPPFYSISEADVFEILKYLFESQITPLSDLQNNIEGTDYILRVGDEGSLGATYHWNDETPPTWHSLTMIAQILCRNFNANNVVEIKDDEFLKEIFKNGL